MKYIKLFALLCLYFGFSIQLQAQYKLKNTSSICLSSLNQLDDKVRISSLIEYFDKLDVPLMSDSIKYLLRQQKQNVLGKITITEQKQSDDANTVIYKIENALDSTSSNNNNSLYKLVYNMTFYVKNNYISLVIDDIKLYFTSLEEAIPIEAFISDKVVLNEQKQHLIKDKATYIMLVTNTLTGITEYFFDKLEPKAKPETIDEPEDDVEPAIIIQVDEYGNTIAQDSVSTDTKDKQIEILPIISALPNTETQMQKLALLSDNYFLANSFMKNRIRNSLSDQNLEQQVYIISKDGFVAKVLSLVPYFISKDVIYGIIESDTSVGQSVLQQIKDRDTFTLSVVTDPNSQIAHSINKALEENSKLNIISIEDRDIFCATTPDGGIAIKGSFLISTNRKVNNLTPSGANSDDVILFEVCNLFINAK